MQFHNLLNKQWIFYCYAMNSTVTPRNTYTAEELASMRLPKLPTTRKNWYELAKRENWEFIEVPGKGPGGVRREFKPSPEVLALIELFKIKTAFDAFVETTGGWYGTSETIERFVAQYVPAAGQPALTADQVLDALRVFGKVGAPPKKPETPKPQAQSQSQSIRYMAAEPSPQPEAPAAIDQALLRQCLGACTLVYGEGFAKEPVALQMEYASALYNTLSKSAALHPGGHKEGLFSYSRLEPRGLAEQLRLWVQMGFARRYVTRPSSLLPPTVF